MTLDRSGHWPHSPAMWVLGLIALAGAAALPLLALAWVPGERHANSYWLGFCMGLVTLVLLYAAGQLGAFQ